MTKTKDPDDVAMDLAADALRAFMTDELKLDCTRRDAHKSAWIAVRTWIVNRANQWSAVRGRATFGDVDGYDIGFAMTALPVIAERCPDMPWHAPIGDWTKEQVATFLATGAMAIEETRIKTLSSEALPA